MRVIAGEFKGRRLSPVPGQSTRPTTDKVKESIFNIIGPYFNGGTVLDLFAGTGALGIEAISRGMTRGIFIDKEPKALQVVRENIEACKLEKQTELYRNDAGRAIQQLEQKQIKIDLVFLDPPYHLHIIPLLMAEMTKRDLLTEEAVLVAEHSAGTVLPVVIESLERWRFAEYGDTAVSFYRKGTFTK